MIDIGSGRIEKTVIRDCPNCSIDEILSPHLSYAAGELAGDELEYAELSPEDSKTSLADAERQAAEQRRNINQNADLTMGQEKKGGGSIFSKWYFWVLVAGAGGGAAVALSSSSGDKNDGPATGNGSIVINWRR
ncbi:MAG: hypothetical protein GY839_18970 [candidate division Zixibacteria bacterium]|nr:hypothetical protein [candidate division Zixibacteria bacterium]